MRDRALCVCALHKLQHGCSRDAQLTIHPDHLDDERILRLRASDAFSGHDARPSTSFSPLALREAAISPPSSRCWQVSAPTSLRRVTLSRSHDGQWASGPVGCATANSGTFSGIRPGKKKRRKALISLAFLAPRPGLEPGTYGLTERRELGLNQRLRYEFRSAICTEIRES